MADHMLTEPLVITDGAMNVIPGPGLGIEIDPEKLSRYRTDN
jgi:L-alanine-DL-glutamate epimerase-like enolase superfamily enzyme